MPKHNKLTSKQTAKLTVLEHDKAITTRKQLRQTELVRNSELRHSQSARNLIRLKTGPEKDAVDRVQNVVLGDADVELLRADEHATESAGK